jgi:hypothetical protein
MERKKRLTTNKRHMATKKVNKQNPKNPIPNAVQFTSENQPSSEARSRGAKRRWQYARLRQDFLEALTNIDMPDGTTRNFWELAVKQLQSYAMGKDSKLSAKEKVDLINKLIAFMPEQKNVNISGSVGVSLEDAMKAMQEKLKSNPELQDKIEISLIDD